MNALVTGGAGFIGSHIATRLVSEGHRVVVLDNFTTGKRENLAHIAKDVRIIEGDIRDAAKVAEAATGATHVFHQAAIVSVPYSVEHPEESNDVNVRGTINVLQAARKAGARRIVFASSAAIYGEEPTLPKVETMLPEPVSPYGVEKMVGEHYLATWSKLFGLESVALRYFNVFGPRQDPKSPYSGVISIFVDRILAGKPVMFFGDGGQTRDFVYVGNVVDANILAATREGVSGKRFNIGCGKTTTLLELAAMIGRVANKPVEKTFADPRPGDIRDSVAEIARARAELGYEPKVGVEEGLRHLVDYARG